MLFDWSRGQHPESTELFANDLFNHLDLLPVFPHMGATVEGEPSVSVFSIHLSTSTTELTKARGAVEILHFWHTSRLPPTFLK